MVNARPRFHLAIPVDDLGAARRFYGEVLGLSEGRAAGHWIDWDFYGHQLVTHRTESRQRVTSNPVDGDDVPVPHFGVILSIDAFHELAEKLKKSGVEFVIAPHVRFVGQPGEQWTMFFYDPAGNPLEIKAFARDAQVFAR
jgi:extradiol dioxygenase family protein